MPVYKWRRRPNPTFGEIWVPFADVRLGAADGQLIEFSLQVDSGAVVSLARRSVAELLGIDRESGRRMELSGVGGIAAVGYIHDITLLLPDFPPVAVPFAIADSEAVPLLLGRLGIFDRFQVDFDVSLTETRITAPWLDERDQRIWKFIDELERHVLTRWDQVPIDEPGKQVAAHFVDRARQLFAAAAGLLKLHRTFEAPQIIRALFEILIQFEYLMQDPARLGQQYLDYKHVSKYEQISAVLKNKHGKISQRLANSPMRSKSEPQIKADYDRVLAQFERPNGKRPWDAWYKMSVHNLAERVNRIEEYRLYYKAFAAWSHGDPFATGKLEPVALADVFGMCYSFYLPMLERLSKGMILTEDQYKVMRMVTNHRII